MAVETIFQGDDKEFEISLTEKDNVTALDLTGVPEIIAKIQDKGGNTIKKYSLTGATGTDPITIPAPATDGKIRFKYQSAETLVTPEGFIDIHGKVTITDTAYVSNTLDRIFEVIDQFQIKKNSIASGL